MITDRRLSSESVSGSLQSNLQNSASRWEIRRGSTVRISVPSHATVVKSGGRGTECSCARPRPRAAGDGRESSLPMNCASIATFPWTFKSSRGCGTGTGEGSKWA